MRRAARQNGFSEYLMILLEKWLIILFDFHLNITFLRIDECFIVDITVK